MCQQILPDANRAQYNRACFLSEQYALFILSSKQVCKDVRKKAEAVYSFPLSQKGGRFLFFFWYIWILWKIRAFDNSFSHVYSTYEPRNIIPAFFAKKLFKKTLTIDLWDDPEKVLMLAKVRNKPVDILVKVFEFFITKKVVQCADNIIIGLVPEGIIKKYSLKNSRVLSVTNGINPGYAFKQSIQKAKNRSDRFTLFYCGTVDSIRLEGLAQCIDKVVDKILTIKIIIIGNQTSEGYCWLLESFRRFGDCVDLDIRGRRPYTSVVQAIEESDVCICPYPDRLDIAAIYPVKIFDYMNMGKLQDYSQKMAISFIQDDQVVFWFGANEPAYK